VKTTGLPPGVSFIIGNEAAERFSYYGELSKNSELLFEGSSH
jgi:hypothetical protein